MKSNLFAGVNGYLNRQSETFLIISGFILVFFLGVVDYLTGAEKEISIFYLLPICLMAWFVNRRAGILLSIASAAVSLTGDLMAGHTYSQPMIVYWNGAVLLGFFLIIVLITETLRRSHDDLEIRVEELRELHSELEDRVEERTAELVQANVQLKYEIYERKRAEEALRESEKQLRYISSSLLTAQETERRRVARELHDELGGALSVLKLRLSSIGKNLQEDQVKLREQCETDLKYIDDIIESVHRLSRDLSPSILQDFGLSAALHWLTNNFGKNYNIKVEFKITIDIDHLFSQEAQIGIYRILQEALTNIGKHAQAKNVSVVIKKHDDRISFVLEDDGRGFDVTQAVTKDATERGLGLATMDERARMLGGFLDLSSQGKGTRITFSVPKKSGGSL